MNKGLVVLVLEGLFYWLGIMALLRYLTGGN